MSNKHTYTSQITERHEYESQIKNSHSFFSIIRNSHFYESIIDGISTIASNSWFAKFIQTNRITISKTNLAMKFKARFYQASSMRISNTAVSLSQLLKPVFKQYNNISARMNIFMRMGNLKIVSYNNIIARMTDQVNIKSVKMIVEPVVIKADMTVKKYYLLSDWDSSSLSTLDTMNLSDMDYQIV